MRHRGPPSNIRPDPLGLARLCTVFADLRDRPIPTTDRPIPDMPGFFFLDEGDLQSVSLEDYLLPADFGAVDADEEPDAAA